MTQPQNNTAQPPQTQPPSIVGLVRNFGANGVPYIVLSVIDSEATIRVLMTGEETTYPVADVLNDPEA